MNPEDDYIFDFVILPSSTLSVAPTSSILLVLAAQSGLPVSETIFTEQIITILPDAVTISTQSSSELSNSKTASQTSSSQPLTEIWTTESVGNAPSSGSSPPMTEMLSAETSQNTPISAGATATTSSHLSSNSTTSYGPAGATINAVASSSALSTASKVGVAISGASFAFLIVAFIFFLRWLRRRRCQSYPVDAGPRHDATDFNPSDDPCRPKPWRSIISSRRSAVASEKRSPTQSELASDSTLSSLRDARLHELDSSQTLSGADCTRKADSLNLLSRSLSGNEGRRYSRAIGWQDVVDTRIELEANEAQ